MSSLKFSVGQLFMIVGSSGFAFYMLGLYVGTQRIITEVNKRLGTNYQHPMRKKKLTLVNETRKK